MARLAEGDRSAFTPAFRVLWPRVHALCLSMLKNVGDADDAAQQAMEKILTRAHEYDPSRPALPWALGVAGWESRSILTRRQRRREVRADASGEPDLSASVDEGIMRREVIDALHEGLRDLSESDRETLIATYFDESQPAANAALRKRRQRAVERLRAAVRRLL
jgi:RNA polymerase sigma-70 factor (ECF subfamily)